METNRINFAISIDGGFRKHKLGPGARPAAAEDFERRIQLIISRTELQEESNKKVVLMSQYKLTNEILKLSVSKVWDTASLEWKLNEIYEAVNPETCLCGHFPIVEICILKNNLNNESVTVGNCCVKKFIGLSSDLIFQAVKRIRKDDQKSLNAQAVHHAFEKGWINAWEQKFSIDTMRKRNLSDKQLQTRMSINKKMLENMKRSGVCK